jgi:hypothetical protein
MKIIAIDYDETIYDNETSQIINKDKINELFETPFNFIIIYTARSWNEFFVIKDKLDANKVKYHTIVCEKLLVDLMIDDKNMGGLKWK